MFTPVLSPLPVVLPASVCSALFTLWFLSSHRRWFSIFFSDLINPLVQASFELIAYVSVTVSICPRSYSQLTSHCPRNFSSLPPLSIMQQRVLEDQAMLRSEERRVGKECRSR